MHLECPREVLAAALQIVSAVVPSRTPKDILKNVKLEVRDGRVMLLGTDTEIGIRYELHGATIDRSGEALLATARVISIVRELGGPIVTLDVTGDSIFIRGAGSEFRLSTQDAAEFPPVPEFQEQASYVMPSKTLRQLIRRTVFAADLESTKYALGGVLAELSPERANFVATDGRRLALASAACSTDGVVESGNTQPVVPSKAMNLIERCLADAGETDAKLVVRANDIVAKVGHATIISQLIQGRFPDYRKVIPKGFNATIPLSVGPFHSAIRQSQIVSDDETRGVDFSFESGVLRLNSLAASVGQSKIEVPIAYDGPAVVTKYDPKYISEFLRVLEPERTVELHLIDRDSAALLTTDDNYSYVIMPLSV